MRQHAGRSDNEDRVTQRLGLAFAPQQRVARGESQLHAVGETDDQDQRRHHVEKHVEAKAQPAERAEHQDDGDQRRAGGHDHERDAPEESDGDQASGAKAEGIVDHPVALDRVADFELHHRHAGQLAGQPGIGQIPGDGLADFVNDVAQAVAGNDRRIKRQHGQRQLPVQRQELAADDLVRQHAIDQFLIVGALRQFPGEQRLGNPSAFGRLARGEQRNNAARAVDQLKVGDQLAQLGQRLAIQQRLAFDDNEDVELARRKAAGDRFVLREFRRIGPKQLAERIVDPDAADAKRRGDAQPGQNQRDDPRKPQRDEANPLDAEREMVRLSPRRQGWTAEGHDGASPAPARPECGPRSGCPYGSRSGRISRSANAPGRRPARSRPGASPCPARS